MSTIEEVSAAEQAVSDKKLTQPAPGSEGYCTWLAQYNALKATANRLRSQFNLTQMAGSFNDLGATLGSDQFFAVDPRTDSNTWEGTRLKPNQGVVNQITPTTSDNNSLDFGKLQRWPQPSEAVSGWQTDANAVLAQNTMLSAGARAKFVYHAAPTFSYTAGSTFTFGGDKDYSYCNGYGVDFINTSPGNIDIWDKQLPFDMVTPQMGSSSFGTQVAFDKDKHRKFVDDDVKGRFFPLTPPNDGASSTTENSRTSDKVSRANHAFFEANEAVVSKTVGDTYDYQYGTAYGVNYGEWNHDTSVYKYTSAYSHVKKSFEETLVEDLAESKTVATLGTIKDYTAALHTHATNHVGFNTELAATGVNASAGITGVGADIQGKGLDAAFEFGLVKYDVSTWGVKFESDVCHTNISHSSSKRDIKITSAENFVYSEEVIQTASTSPIYNLSNKQITFIVDNGKESKTEGMINKYLHPMGKMAGKGLLGLLGIKPILMLWHAKSQTPDQVKGVIETEPKDKDFDFSEITMTQYNVLMATKDSAQANGTSFTRIESDSDKTTMDFYVEAKKDNNKTTNNDKKAMLSFNLDAVSGEGVKVDKDEMKLGMNLNKKDYSKLTFTGQKDIENLLEAKQEKKTVKYLQKTKDASIEVSASNDKKTAALKMSAGDSYSLALKEQAKSSSMTMKMGSNAVITVKDGTKASMTVTKKDITLDADKGNVTLKSTKATVKGKTGVMVSGAKVELKAQSLASLKSGGGEVKVAANGVHLKSNSLLTMKSNALIQVTGSIIKLG